MAHGPPSPAMTKTTLLAGTVPSSASRAKTMQIHRLSLPNHTLYSSSFSLSPHTSTSTPSLPSNCAIKLAYYRKRDHGFAISVKRVSSFTTSLRRQVGLVRVRCEQVEDDGFYIRRCVELARRAIGRTSPNPMVGCIIVKDGKAVGEGFHPKAGQPHAEVFALRDAGHLAEGATAYVSLEPCNHYGRTPPCTEALIKAKVKKVVVGMVDPNPIVASKGVDRLRNVGIEVKVGVEEALCKRLIEAYIHKMLTGKPFVTLRYSLSVNGCLLDHLGQGVSEAGGYYSRLLQEYDAVILSASSTEHLSGICSQEQGAQQPLRIIVPSPGRQFLKPVPHFIEEAAPKTVLLTDNSVAFKPDMSQIGIETVGLDRLKLSAILDYCVNCGLCSVLLDIRGSLGDLEALLKEGIEQKLFQKIIVEVLPIWKADDGDKSLGSLSSSVEFLKLKNLLPKVSDQSILLEAYL